MSGPVTTEMELAFLEFLEGAFAMDLDAIEAAMAHYEACTDDAGHPTSGLGLAASVVNLIASLAAEENDGAIPDALAVIDSRTGKMVDPDTIDSPEGRAMVLIGRSLSAVGRGDNPVEFLMMIRSDEEAGLVMSFLIRIIHDVMHRGVEAR